MQKLRYALMAACLVSSSAAFAKPDTLIVAGGCFWCVESDFQKVDGVLEVVSGYTGGHVANPTYKQVAAKKTGHYEAVIITYDDEKVKLRTLVDRFWKTIDPTDAYGQFCDKGEPYRTAVFYKNEVQKKTIEASLAAVKQSKPFKAPIVTPVLPAKPFYMAEKYHQDYAQKNPVRYRYYRYTCGRDARVESLWGGLQH